MSLARSERAGLCDLLDEVGPDAPTLCEGWSTHDLAVHLWIRETDPIGASGLVAKPLAGLLDRRMAEVKQRWEFGELVERLRNGPARFSVFSLPGLDEPANGTEYLVHHEDVRRAGAHPLPARDLGVETEDFLWRRLKLLGRALFRRSPVGVVLERSPGPASDATRVAPPQPVPQADRDTIRAVAGTPIVTLIGRPSEFLLYGMGRQAAAEVEIVGEPEAVAALNGADFRT